jgi:hypothetical protein
MQVSARLTESSILVEEEIQIAVEGVQYLLIPHQEVVLLVRPL